MKLLLVLFLVALSGAVPSPDPEAAADPVADPAPEADPTVVDLNPEDAGCGPPYMNTEWRERSVAAGDSLLLSCPLDTKNSCIIDFVEWWYSTSDPRGSDSRSGQSLLRDAAVSFDPLLAHFPNIGPEQEGWYTCVVGNSEGRSQSSVRVRVVGTTPPGSRRDRGRDLSAQLREQRRLREMESQRRIEEMERQNTRLNMNLRGTGGGSAVAMGGGGGVRRQDGGAAARGGDQMQIVYSRTRGDRGFYPAVPGATPAPAPAALMQRPVSVVTRRPPAETVHVNQRSEWERVTTAAGGGGGGSARADASSVESLHQHIRYVYDRIDEMARNMERLERRVAILEMDSSEEED